MISFANPIYLYLLPCVLLLAGIYALGRIIDHRNMNRFGRYKVLERLMPDRSRYMPTIKVLLQLGGITFVLLAASRPYVHTNSDATYQGEEETVNGIEVMICCDLSNSMLASSTADIKGVSRLQRAKYLLDKTLDDMINDRVGIIVFAGNAYLQLPLSPDVQAAKMLVNGMSTGLLPMQGTSIGAAIDMALNSFDPESQFSKTILLVTDGENFEDDAVAAARKAAEAGVQVNVIGVGVPGQPMPVPVAEGSEEYLTYNGETAMTAPDDAAAAEIAEAGGGIYISGGASNAVSQIDTQLDKLSAKEYVRTAIPSDSTDLFPIAIAIAFILLSIDLFVPYTKLKWLRNTKFFSGK